MVLWYHKKIFLFLKMQTSIYEGNVMMAIIQFKISQNNIAKAKNKLLTTVKSR